MANPSGIEYSTLPISVETYNRLRLEAGWHEIATGRASAALKASVFTVTASAGEQVVGCGRITGDGGIYFYVQDILVASDFRGRGIGTEIMERIMIYLAQVAPAGSGAFLGLMISPGFEHFYSRFGFSRLPDASPFLGQWKNGH
jgi:GNAT superfamily N-acetyltransferase